MGEEINEEIEMEMTTFRFRFRLITGVAPFRAPLALRLNAPCANPFVPASSSLPWSS